MLSFRNKLIIEEGDKILSEKIQTCLIKDFKYNKVLKINNKKTPKSNKSYRKKKKKRKKRKKKKKHVLGAPSFVFVFFQIKIPSPP